MVGFVMAEKFSKELSAALNAAKQASKIINSFYKKDFDVELKKDGTPVTQADKLAEKKIFSVLKKSFPNYGFFGEESGESGSMDCRWIVDPLDGTKNFSRKIPFFGSLIALEKHGEIAAGVLSMPVFNEFMYAEKGKGAFLNGKRIHVSKVSDLGKSMLTFGGLQYFKKYGTFGKLQKLIDKSMFVRSFGDILGYNYISRGRADVLVEAEVSPWDIAAAKIVVEEAGGKFSDFSGKDSIYSGNCIASNGILHENVLKIFREK